MYTMKLLSKNTGFKCTSVAAMMNLICHRLSMRHSMIIMTMRPISGFWGDERMSIFERDALTTVMSV